MDPFAIIMLNIGFFLLFVGMFLVGLLYALYYSIYAVAWLINWVVLLYYVSTKRQTMAYFREQRSFGHHFPAVDYWIEKPADGQPLSDNKWQAQCPALYRWYQRVTGKTS